MEITLDITVEDLVEVYPRAATFLADHHVVCIVCGEPYWGTLQDLMTSKGIEDPDTLLQQLKDYLQQDTP